MEIKDIIKSIKDEMDKRGGLKSIYFVGLGGSLAAIYPGKYLLSSELKDISVHTLTSNEFIYSNPKSIDERTLCILCSLKGSPETVEAANHANEKGAITIAMSGSSETEMAKQGQYVVVYSSGDNQIYSKSNQSMSLRISFEILKQFENYKYYDEAIEIFNYIDDIFDKAKSKVTEKAIKFALDNYEKEHFYVLSSGPSYGTAYSMAMCHLMEMQWLNATPIHSGEFFHGPFEITDNEVVFVLIKNIGKTRPLDERVEKFLKKFANNYLILDAEETGLSDLNENVVEYFNSVIMLPIERYVVTKLANMRNHSMDKRRYMWQFDY